MLQKTGFTQPSDRRRRCWEIIDAHPRLAYVWRAVSLVDGLVFERSEELWHGWGRPKTPHGLIRANCGIHRSRPILLGDGTLVNRGDVVLHIHLETHAIRQTRRCDLLPKGMEDYRVIAQWVQSGTGSQYGITAVHCQGILSHLIVKLGDFAPHVLDGPKVPWLQLYFEGYIILHHPKGLAYFNAGCKPVIDGWQSAAAFVRKFGQDPDHTSL